ncbi:class D sortase [Heyndrickxia acidicola]|uniref:Class D sortase n=1 Tax=Heyndrickxia acidicola TaxID=209389 RepID=A0ABU6MIN9_9BACI|nr:class D sortase [Heyndrickxia acidicola]MED1204324.1 class D sortase [Heyndrickxia acidicola]
MMKRAAVALFAAGVLCIGYSVLNSMESRHEQMSALSQAKRMIQNAHLEKMDPGIKVKKTAESKEVPKTNGKNGSEKESILGILRIPRLHKELPIIEGTSEAMLRKGVGHFTGSGLPGQHNQIVFSGHRDTVFRHVGELKKGDELIADLQSGTFVYVINHMKVVKADDRTVIHSTAPKEELILTTCYPFYYIGDAPDRYIIYAYPKMN